MTSHAHAPGHAPFARGAHNTISLLKQHVRVAHGNVAHRTAQRHTYAAHGTHSHPCPSRSSTLSIHRHMDAHPRMHTDNDTAHCYGSAHCCGVARCFIKETSRPTAGLQHCFCWTVWLPSQQSSKTICTRPDPIPAEFQDHPHPPRPHPFNRQAALPLGCCIASRRFAMVCSRASSVVCGE